MANTPSSWKTQRETVLDHEDNHQVRVWERAQQTMRCLQATRIVLSNRLQTLVPQKDIRLLLGRLVWASRIEAEWGLWGRPDGQRPHLSDVKRVWLEDE